MTHPFASVQILSLYVQKLGLPYQTAMNGAEAVQLYMQSYASVRCILMGMSLPPLART